MSLRVSMLTSLSWETGEDTEDTEDSGEVALLLKYLSCCSGTLFSDLFVEASFQMAKLNLEGYWKM